MDESSFPITPGRIGTRPYMTSISPSAPCTFQEKQWTLVKHMLIGDISLKTTWFYGKCMRLRVNRFVFQLDLAICGESLDSLLFWFTTEILVSPPAAGLQIVEVGSLRSSQVGPGVARTSKASPSSYKHPCSFTLMCHKIIFFYVP